MLKRKKKYSLTLLEITVAFFLVSILLSTLWGMYHSWLLTYQKNQKSQSHVHKILFLKERLDKLSSLVATSSLQEAEDEKNFVFTPQEKVEGIPTVCFSYQNDPDPEPSFNGRVRSLLYVNSIKQLCLATWAMDKQVRIDLLLQAVSSFSLSYFDPQTNLWRDDWPDTLKHLPLWMKLNIDANEKLELIFRLDYPIEPILYLEDS